MPAARIRTLASGLVPDVTIVQRSAGDAAENLNHTRQRNNTVHVQHFAAFDLAIFGFVIGIRKKLPDRGHASRPMSPVDGVLRIKAGARAPTGTRHARRRASNRSGPHPNRTTALCRKSEALCHYNHKTNAKRAAVPSSSLLGAAPPFEGATRSKISHLKATADVSSDGLLGVYS